ARGVSFAAATAVGCGAAAGVDPELALTADASGAPTPWAATCTEAVPELQAQGLGTDPDLVVLHSSWETSDRIVAGRHVPFGTTEWDSIVRAELRAAVDRLSAGGAVVALLTIPPIVDGELRVAPADDNARIARLGALLADVARTSDGRAVLVDLAALVCGRHAPCPTTLDGVVLRPLDGAHFEPDGAAVVAPRLADLLGALDVGP
nr:hypothetical protein [Acidimicrobiia bacterium]